MSLAQQKRLYEAEACLWGHGREFSSNQEAADYLNTVVESEWFVRQYGWIPPIKIETLRSTKWGGCADTKNFVIHLRRRTENVVLHELSHLLCSTDDHDYEFTNIFLGLVRNFMGFYAWSEFAYELKRVDYFGS